jgi:hypothetical protein
MKSFQNNRVGCGNQVCNCHTRKFALSRVTNVIKLDGMLAALHVIHR